MIYRVDIIFMSCETMFHVEDDDIVTFNRALAEAMKSRNPSRAETGAGDVEN